MAVTFAHLSDPHLTTLAGIPLRQFLSKRLLSYLSWRRKRRFEHRPEVLNTLVQDLDQHHCAQILISGDLTHTGLPAEFREARAWLERLGPSDGVAVIPGNHDSLVATSWEQSYAHWEPYIASDPAENPEGNWWPSLRVRDDIAFIGLSTALPTAPLMATGEVDAQQLEALTEQLQTHCGKFRVVYLHHSPVEGAEKWRKRLRNSAEVRQRICSSGAELVLHGHGHRQRWSELPGPNGAIPVLAVPSSSARGLYGADLAAYNLCTVACHDHGWSLAVERRELASDLGHFAVTESREFLLRRSPP
ncbi:MAG: metallophosphoesterase [Pseudomonadota bacterium]